MFYNQQLHLLQLALSLPSKAGCFRVLNLTVRVNFCSFCLCGCITSHQDAMVLHSLSPSLVIKDSLDLVDVLCRRRRSQTGTEPRQFQLSGNRETTPAKHEFFVPLTLLHYLVTEIRLGCNSKQVICVLLHPVCNNLLKCMSKRAHAGS